MNKFAKSPITVTNIAEMISPKLSAFLISASNLMPTFSVDGAKRIWSMLISASPQIISAVHENAKLSPSLRCCIPLFSEISFLTSLPSFTPYQGSRQT